tara:strand:+ start:826 stop:1200 length:375 start_codon:yes stop_codon:yes gene_type:complete
MSEKEEHIKICEYIKGNYPNVIFTSESSGIRLSISQAKTLKKMRSNAGLPDLMIFEARKGYNGLFLEIKKIGTIIYKKDGDLRSDEHLIKQKQVLINLRNRGYLAEFVIGFENAKPIIDFYFSI